MQSRDRTDNKIAPRVLNRAIGLLFSVISFIFPCFSPTMLPTILPTRLKVFRSIDRTGRTIELYRGTWRIVALVRADRVMEYISIKSHPLFPRRLLTSFLLSHALMILSIHLNTNNSSIPSKFIGKFYRQSRPCKILPAVGQPSRNRYLASRLLTRASIVKLPPDLVIEIETK